MAACVNCGRAVPRAEMAGDGWCPDCRSAVVRHASRWAGAASALVAVLAILLIFLLTDATRFLVFWLLVVGLAAFVAFKVARRIAFEIIQARGVRT